MKLAIDKILGSALGLLLLAGGCNTLKVDHWEAERERGEALVPPLELAWTYNAGAGFGPGAPHLMGDVVLVGTRRGEAHAIGLESGKRLGLKRFGDVIESTPLFIGGDMVVPVAWGRRALVSYDLQQGRTNWARRGALVAAGLLALEDGFVAVDGDGVVRRYSAQGEVRWERRPGGLIRSRPVLVDGRVIVADEQGLVTALDTESGSRLWERSHVGPVYASMAVFGSRLVIPTTRGKVVFLEASTGGEQNVYHTPDSTVRYSEPAVDGAMMAVGGSDGSLIAFSQMQQEPVWKFSGPDAFASAPVVAETHVFAASMGRMLYALDRASGKLEWETELRGRVKSALVARNGHLVVLAEPRYVQLFKSGNAAP